MPAREGMFNLRIFSGGGSGDGECGVLRSGTYTDPWSLGAPKDGLSRRERVSARDSPGCLASPRRARQDGLVALSPHLQALFDAIRASHPNGLTLDELSEELVTKSVTYADVDELIGALEDEAGFDLAGPVAAGRPEDLARVLEAVRALVAETGQRPSAAAIAARVGLTPTAVRKALRLAGSATR